MILVHHENKGGAVSGAWEGAGDTLLHVQAAGNGHTVLFVQKARWDSERHGKALHLAWAAGDGFELEGDREYLTEIEALLADGSWRTTKEIASSKEKGGIGADEKMVRALLNDHPQRFESRTGDAAVALGRRSSATVWQLSSGLNSVNSLGEFQGGAEELSARCVPLRAHQHPDAPPATQPELSSDLKSPPAVAPDPTLEERP